MRISDAIAAGHQAWERHTEAQQAARSSQEDVTIPANRPSMIARLLARLKGEPEE